MSKLDYGLWLAGQAASGLLYAWPVSALVVLAVAYSFRSAPVASRKKLVVVFLMSQLLLLVPGAHLILGTVLEAPAPRQGAFSPESLTALNVLQVGQFALAAILVYLAGAGLRLRALSCALPSIWYSLWAWFVAGMSVTGDWL